jgi:Dolichyl-phosphate-mannose-protein mannosyltransferase
VWGALGLVLWSAAIFLSGGFRITVFDVAIASRDPLRPLALAAVLVAGGYAVFGRRAIDDELGRVAGAFDNAASIFAIVTALAVLVFGLRWGSFAAGGVDAYGYVSQAALWRHGTLRVEQPFVASVSWPAADSAFAPMGYRAATGGHAIVPSYAPGLPLLMAFAELAAGACGPYYVAPIMGGLCVWCCFLIGRRVSSPAAAACAAMLLACSPAFLFHLVVPMSDVPATALWSAAIWAALRGGTTSAAGAGAFAALAVLVRPNLAPLAVVLGAFVAMPGGDAIDSRARWKRAGWFSAAAFPSFLMVAVINWRLYGSPVRSGYDDLGDTYALNHIVPNAWRYAGWLIQSQSPLIALGAIGMIAPLIPRASVLRWRAAALFLAFTLVLTASYLPYVVFEDWYFVRYFLPVLPLLLVSLAGLLINGGSRMPPPICVFGAIALMTFLIGHQLRFALGAGLIRSPASERRYVAVARYIESSMPKDAVFLTLQHGGSVRHYSNRLTLRFDLIPVGLDDALASLERAGWRPFILLEDWEETQFKAQFGAASAAGRLAWRPLARLTEPGGVNIYDPKSSAGATPHELAIIPAAQPCDCRHY